MMEHREIEVHQGFVVRVTDVAASFNAPSTLACQQYRQIIVIVGIAVRNATAVDDHAIV